MFGKNGSSGGSGSHAVTIIGAGVRVDGNLTFKGFLRVQGDVLGDVTCDGDVNGTIVVHSSGNVTGTIRTPRVVVSGRVTGPVHSAESIEIHEGACVLGDAHYKLIDVHAGGVIDGLLTPTPSIAEGRSKPQQRAQAPEAPAVKEREIPRADPTDVTIAPARSSGWLKFAAATALILGGIAGAVVWVMKRDSSVIPPTPVHVVVEAEPAAKIIVAPPPAVSEPKEVAKPLVAPAVPPVPAAKAESKTESKKDSKKDSKTEIKPDGKAVLQAAAALQPAADSGKLVEITGVNPDKPADVFFINSKEPAVLLKKKRDDGSEGTRIDVARGAKRRIAIADDEIFRVAEGHNVEVFYQGRKVAPKIVQSGAWMSFVPQTPAPGGEGEPR